MSKNKGSIGIVNLIKTALVSLSLLLTSNVFKVNNKSTDVLGVRLADVGSYRAPARAPTTSIRSVNVVAPTYSQFLRTVERTYTPPPPSTPVYTPPAYTPPAPSIPSSPVISAPGSTSKTFCSTTPNGQTNECSINPETFALACTWMGGGGCGGGGGGGASACSPVNGGWSEWGTCSSSCNGTLTRTCTNPAPSCSGAGCVGTNIQACNTSTAYTLKVPVKDAENGCGSLGSGIEGASVSVYNMVGGVAGTALVDSPGTTDASGIATFSNVPVTSKSFAISVSKSTGGTNPDFYQLICPTMTLYGVDLPSDPVACETITVPTGAALGIKKIPKYPWITVIDGDIFSSAVATTIPSGSGLGGFSLSLINSKIDTALGIGGYLFTKGDIATNDNSIYEGSLGGKVFDITNNSIINHNDVSLIKLAKRSFGPPTHNEVVELTNINTFEAGKIYKISVSDFNSKISSGPVTYTISQSTDPNLASAMVSTAIMYITGTDDVEFKNQYLSTNPFARIIIVTDAKVIISKDVAFSNIATYTVFASPLIQAGIISSKEIVIESNNTTPASDNPIMLSSPVISMSAITSNRNIGIYNGYLPSLSVSYYPKFLYDLAIIERLQSYSGSRSYTGIHTYDLQFDYQY